MRKVFCLRFSARLLAVSIALTGIIGVASPLTVGAAPGNLTQVTTAVVNGPTALAMSGTASCTGGGTDTIQTVLVSQGLTVGAIGTISNAVPCDGNSYPWGIVEGTTLGSWAGGSNVTSVVAFSSSLLSTNMATLTPASGVTFWVSNSGGVIDSTHAFLSGTASCTGGGTKTIELQYTQYDVNVSASGSTTVSCDGASHSWSMNVEASGGTWSSDGTAVGHLLNSSSQAVATYTTPLNLAA